ncbi:uncharacterized protein HKW66_Vig0249150 [Vigna angularis]|uniref:Uncharacterized protein n=1 Tax=Phaseolus angularis TaxID=3914 RepID=A0A8T0JS45_PHAAN|nr:uncharacterized protein HKW66_Vig0249150 [Vigna angularis]
MQTKAAAHRGKDNTDSEQDRPLDNRYNNNDKVNTSRYNKYTDPTHTSGSRLSLSNCRSAYLKSG